GAQPPQRRSDRDDVAGLGDRLEVAGGVGAHLDLDLVGFHDDDRLAGFDPLAGSDQPPHHLGFLHGEPKLGKGKGGGHPRPSHEEMVDSTRSGVGTTACSSWGLTGIGTARAPIRSGGASTASKASSTTVAATSAPQPPSRTDSSTVTTRPVR